MLFAIISANMGGTALPIAFLTSSHLPTKANSSGKDCAPAASRIVSEQVAVGCTFLQSEIILKFVVIVEHGSPLYTLVCGVKSTRWS